MTKIYNRISEKLKRRELRNRQTDAEKLLWQCLRNKKAGIKFKRQYSFENYIIDFYAPSAKLAIEIDGSQHYDKEHREYDKIRDKILSSAGIKILRFTNEEVIGDLDKVIEIVKES